MTFIDTLYVILLTWNVVGFVIWVLILTESDYGRESEGFRFINPLYVYEHLRVNYFGMFCITLILNLLCPLGACGYWFYKLCTVGRK